MSTAQQPQMRTEDREPGGWKAALDAALASLQFRDSPRQRQLLSYLVTEEMAGRGDRLNAYSIAFDALERGTDFNAATDSSVRVEMHRLRQNLAALKQDPANTQPVILDIPPRSYRPVLVDRGSLAVFGKIRKLALSPMLLMVAIAALCASGAAVWFFQKGAECHSARPGITIPTRIAQLSPEKSDRLLDQLETFLRYYPLVAIVPGPASGCSGPPRYDLVIARVAEGLEVRLSEQASKNTVLRRAVPLRTNATDSDQNIAMAQIAYALGHDNGAIPLDAIRRTWTNASANANAEYRCLMLAHQYFVSNTSSDDFLRAHNCLVGFFRNSEKADVPAMLAALDLDAEFNPELKESLSHNYFHEAIAAANQIDPLNTELLMVRLRRARTQQDYDPGNLQALLLQMEQLYPYEPHIINQLAIARCKSNGDYEKAYVNIGISRKIANGFMGLNTATIYCNVASGNSIKNEQFVEEFKYFENLSDLLITLDYADAAGDQNLARLTVDKLTAMGCRTRACLIQAAHVAATNPDFRSRLQQVIEHYFAA